MRLEKKKENIGVVDRDINGADRINDGTMLGLRKVMPSNFFLYIYII